MTQLNSSLSIGIFDSGLGGLSILNEISKRLPEEHLLYLADSNNAPYGQKSPEVIVEISRRNTEFLLSKGCKLIVVACNTATTNAIDVLRNSYKVPFVGIEPAIKPAALNSINGRVGVLATKGTLSSALFSRTARKFTVNTKVTEVEGKGIVEAIESNTTHTIAFEKLLREQLKPFKVDGIDTLVLGCSHYPFIMLKIQKYLGQNVKIIDSGFAVAKQTEKILQHYNMQTTQDLNQQKGIHIYTNGTSDSALKSIINQLSIENYHCFDSPNN
jgi:glutamate racemase